MTNEKAQASPAPSTVTFVMTSCGRFDLLRQTLRSFFEHVDYPIEHYIFTEDSGDEAINEVIKEFGIEDKTTVIINNPQLGLLKSIDKAYALIKTPYIFHCEDDWEFSKATKIASTIGLLENDPHALQVYLRNPNECQPLAIKEPLKDFKDVRYRKIDPFCHPEWFGYSTNPGIRRTEDYHRLDSYAEYKNEIGLSKAYKRLGFYMLMLENGGLKHIGDGQHVNDPTLPKRPKTFIGRFKRSINKRFVRLKDRIKYGKQQNTSL